MNKQHLTAFGNYRTLWVFSSFGKIDTYRRGIDNIMAIKQAARAYLNTDKQLILTYLDVEKAFDSVPRKNIIAALRRHACPEPIIDQILGICREHTFVVRDRRSTSRQK